MTILINTDQRQILIERNAMDEEKRTTEEVTVTEPEKEAAEQKQTVTGEKERKARRKRWKQQKADQRRELKERYKDAPWITRVARLYLLKPLVVLLSVVLVGGVIFLIAQSIMSKALDSYYTSNKNKPVSEEKIYEMSPIDEEGQKRIDAVPPVGKDETWTISVYIVGSNLEDLDVNELSSVVMNQIGEAQSRNAAEQAAGYTNRLKSFTGELGENGLEIPAYLYYPRKSVKSESDSEDDEDNADEPGHASIDISEMTSDTWSDNIRIVIQTGGATRWSNSMVNPNRTQRFLYDKGVFEKVYDKPLQPAASPETLTSFLKYCRKKYPADHNMLVLWNHGGGAFGYGNDTIFGNGMSLADIRTALEGAFEPNQQDPAFDIIGFDACLMSSLEVTHALRGFASYYAVSEEAEPGDGWDYGPWLKAMTDDPSMSPAKVAQHIADSYMNYYMTQNVNIGWLITNDVTFSVLDAAKAEELYQAWCELTKQQLIDAATDSSVLSEMGRCSNKSTHYVTMAYNIYNTIDLGNYVDLMADTYPDQCSRIKKLIGETVMYHRESGSLSDSQGITVYMPGSVETYPGLAYCLNYIYNICDDPSTQALYYYKIGGCLNEDMKAYLATLTDKEANVLDLKPFRKFERTTPVITDEGFDIPVGDKLQSMLASYELEAAVYDEEKGVITSFGRDETVRLDGEGNMDCEFDGTWICYDGVPLATEVVSSSDSYVEYRSKVLYNGKECYLSFTWDRDDEVFNINGIRGVSDLAGGILNNEQFNYLINTRMNTEVKPGDQIVPLYEVSVSNADSSGSDPEKGDKIRVSRNSKIEVSKLPAGYYLTAAVIKDQRGDVYYSHVVGNEVSGGSVSSRKVDTDFLGTDY